ncbi:Putative glutathione S-transferase [Magnetospirillum gryphiswaldense MSR-1 v2]|uniref:Glutathione S-transferase n=1 Tax=Magnetospirillum gryphiswaldense (strain DSM 6361 / JCM 21280 / NBRC 15271 / MSR-1) TaxID=431944 RepID=V6F2I6_MAGGM|nr:glutathione S-transferase N-terminal domain-containing protein [Magnetospirillum gryphiswaldense]CDK99740.1 Putative glutathione S-transferase [Magnetospirillum gryphiswaldense MSR-1 v2]
MIDLYTWGTPNGRKVSIMLEECGLPYRVHPIDIMKGDQFSPDFIAINPNSKIPAIIDQDGPGGTPFSLFESGAILIYLAGKTGRFLPADARGRSETLQWLMFQMGGIGPMFGQTHHFRKFAPEPIPYAIERYSKETKRLYGVLNTRLGQSDFVAGEYSIADMAIYPWCQRADWQGIDLNAFPHVARWMETMSERPAVERGMSVPG